MLSKANPRRERRDITQNARLFGADDGIVPPQILAGGYLVQKDQLISLFNERGKKLKKNRKIMGSKYRKLLLQEVKGRTLEVAVGAGANFHFYPRTVDLVAVDFSSILLEIAKECARDNNLNVSFINSDVESLSFEENSFDTIVSTLTLCAYHDPVKVLQNFNKWCKAEGKILLFEHGIGSNKVLNWFLNKGDNWNLKKNGCHLNLDIKKIILESGLVIEEMQTVIMGTHYLIKAKPYKQLRKGIC